MTVDSTKLIEPVISPAPVTTDAIGTIPDKRTGATRCATAPDPGRLRARSISAVHL